MRSLLLAVVATLVSTQAATAQTLYNPNPPISAPYSRPALSPYFNLLRGGDPAANYYLGVLTEYDRRFRESQIGLPRTGPTFLPQGVDYAPDEADVPVRKLSPSGHAAGFMIYQGYYAMPYNRPYLPYNPNANYNNPNAFGGNQNFNQPMRNPR